MKDFKEKYKDAKGTEEIKQEVDRIVSDMMLFLLSYSIKPSSLLSIFFQQVIRKKASYLKLYCSKLLNF